MKKITFLLFPIFLFISANSFADNFSQKDRNTLTRLEVKVNENTKNIEFLRSDIKDIRSDIKDLRSDMNTKFDSLRSDMNTKYDSLRSEMNTKYDNLRSDIKDLRSDMNEQSKDLNNFKGEMYKQIDNIRGDLQGMLKWIVGLLVAFMIAIIGLIIWDRKTSLNPLEKKFTTFENNEKERKKNVRLYIKSKPEMTGFANALGYGAC